MASKREIPQKSDPIPVLRSQFNWALVGVGVLAFVPIGLIACDIPWLKEDLSHQDVLNVISRWQTLLAGTFAVLGAVLSVRAIVLQTATSDHAERARIESAEELESKNRARELLAARAVLPIPLDALADYSTDIAMAVDQVLGATTASTISLPAGTMPTLPSAPLAAVSDLKAFIKAAAPAEGQAVADIISDLQIISAQASGYWINAMHGGHSSTHRSNFESLIGRSAVLHGRLSALFPYARREQHNIDPLSEEHVRNSLNLWFFTPNPAYTDAALRALRYFQRRAHETAPPQSPTTD